MSGPISHPLHALRSHYSEGTLPPLPEHLESWWREMPFLAPVGREAYLPELSLGKKDLHLTKGEKAEEAWNKGTYALTPRLASPGMILGILFTFIGASGCLTVLSGVEIPGLEFLKKFTPATLTFFLISLQGGIHVLDDSIKAARKHNRFRQETNQIYQQFRIADAIGDLSSTERRAKAKKVILIDERMEAQFRLGKTQSAQAFYGKDVDDLPHVLSTNCMKQIQDALNSFSQDAPTLDPPEGKGPIPRIDPGKRVTMSSRKAPSKGAFKDFGTKIANYLSKKQSSLGVIDMALSQVMLLMAMAGIIFICIPHFQIAGFEFFLNDPSLSIPFCCIWLVRWINGTRRGWRMLDFNKREIKRAKIESQLQLISLGIEKCRLEAYVSWIRRQINDLKGKSSTTISNINQLHIRINSAVAHYRGSIRNNTTIRGIRDYSAKEEALDEKKLAYHAHRLGKKMVPLLATPSIVLGILLIGMSMACLGIAAGDVMPDSFGLLVKNTSLTIIAITTLFVLGAETIYRGVSLADFKDKSSQKEAYSEIRVDLINKLFDYEKSKECINFFLAEKVVLSTPKKGESKKSEKSRPATVNAVSSESQRDRITFEPHLRSYQSRLIERKGWYGFWAKVIRKPIFLIPQGLSGTFLLLVSCAGLLLSVGCISNLPPSLDFIAREPSASATFFFSLLSISISTLHNTWRSHKYKDRKDEDMYEVNLIKKCRDTLFASEKRAIKV